MWIECKEVKEKRKMKKLLSLLTMALMICSIMPFVAPAGTGGSIGGGIVVEEFEPIVWQCGGRTLYDDEVQPWRTSNDGEILYERAQQYLFEGERYSVDVVVFDKNKIQDALVDLVLEGEDECVYECVYDPVSGECEEVATCAPYGDFEINCVENSNIDLTHCNARIDEEVLCEDEKSSCPLELRTMQGYTCTIDVLDSEHMYGLFWLKVRAVSALTDTEGEYDEVARWFINPIISLSVDGDLDFDEVRPGTASYSNVLLENTAEGGVLLDMFITGKDWPAADSELGRCWDATNSQYVNYLPLESFRYYAENGAYSTRTDKQIDDGTYNGVPNERNSDTEGYMNIHKQLNSGFEEEMFDECEIIQEGNPVYGTKGYAANVLYPGSAGMSMTFRLELPEPCYGNFESESDGSIFFWGEAI